MSFALCVFWRKLLSHLSHRNPWRPKGCRVWRRPIKPKTVWLCTALACALLVVGVKTQTPPKPKHINRAIELLEAGQPIYYTGSHSGTVGTFEHGKADSGT